jgi:alpha-methylacyl-CoA racemase
MLLADAGAAVLRIDRAAGDGPQAVPTEDMLARHKASIAVDLKAAGGVALVKELVKHADVLIDPFRPGVLERLGLGPDDLLPANRRLVYARMVGFRRDGRYAEMAGHDINYLAVSGVLGLLGRAGQKPHPPWNILADFAGGGGTLFQGILLALLVRQTTGVGQVVEANMVDGSSYLASFPRFALQTPLGDQVRGENILDGGCPYYDTYETLDAKYVAVGALEPQFFRALIEGLGLQGQSWERRRFDRSSWPEMRRQFEAVFKSNTRQHWESVFDGTDACCTPVLEYGELESDPRREGDQRPPVTLRSTPLLAVKEGAVDVAQGQGVGIPGCGYAGRPLKPGEGGEAILGGWLGWTKGREFDERDGGLILRGRSRL